MISYSSGTPAQRWQAFQEEGVVHTSPPNKIPESKELEIKNLLTTKNPETGALYTVPEVAKSTGIGKSTISLIHSRTRRAELKH